MSELDVAPVVLVDHALGLRRHTGPSGGLGRWATWTSTGRGIAYDTMVRVRVVLDSNVLVAALRSRRGASFRLLELLRKERFEIAVSVPLVFEYEAVLVRHAAQLGLSRREAVGVVNYVCRVARRQDIHYLWRPALTDPRDEFILELAVAGGCQAIVTHNVRDFSGARPFGVQVLTPAEFLASIEEDI